MHYGIIVDNVLASIAASYVTLPRIYVIGGVFTREKYRGRGYAKAVTSALTREAAFSGAIAGLHVEADNEPAIKVYKNLGYQITKTRTWIFAHP
ncbi:MAG: GNAT family N-acetyltransferase [Nitrososphaerota archaeon]